MRILATIQPALMPSTILLGVDFAVTSAEVMRSLRRSRYDVLVLGDMTDESSAAFARRIRADGWTIPVILVSSEEVILPDVEIIHPPGSDLEIDVALQRARDKLPDSRGEDEKNFGFRELLLLTRESTRAQTFSADQIAQMSEQLTGMRRDLVEFQVSVHRDAHELEAHIDNVKAHAEKQREAILASMDNTIWRRIRDVFRWTLDHPLAAAVFFVAFLGILFAVALALRVAGPDNVKLLRDLYRPAASSTAGSLLPL